MTRRAALYRSGGSRPLRIPARLRNSALALALAAAGLSASNAWAITDVCGAGTTTISASNSGADDQFCGLTTGESLAVNPGITFNASTLVQATAVTVSGAPAGSVVNSGTIFSAFGNSMTVAVTLGNGVINFASGTIDGAEGIVVGGAGVLAGGILNGGTITTHGEDDCDAIHVLAGGQITGGIFNAGTISHCNEAGRVGIWNQGSIDQLDNRQGQSGGNPLQYRGVLPGAYKIIVFNTGTYGKLEAFTPTSTMTFDISPGSTLQVNTYTDVLIGVLPNNLTGPLSGIFGAFRWELVLANPSGVWDLVVTPLPQAAVEVPALPVWGGALLAAMLGLFGVLGLRRKR
jgi:hypothetical protein